MPTPLYVQIMEEEERLDGINPDTPETEEEVRPRARPCNNGIPLGMVIYPEPELEDFKYESECRRNAWKYLRARGVPCFPAVLATPYEDLDGDATSYRSVER